MTSFNNGLIHLSNDLKEQRQHTSMRSEAGTEHQESNTRKALSLHYWRVAI
jgi:hypothetical protein